LAHISSFNQINNKKYINASDYADHVALSMAQLETVSLMLAILDQTGRELSPPE
jgi:hypothetical protein